MNIFKLLVLFQLLFIVACQDEKTMIEMGNGIISKIEFYKDSIGEVPDSLPVIGVKVMDESNPPFYYEKMGKLVYRLSFSNGVGESKIYYSDTQQWEDFPREMMQEDKSNENLEK